MQVYDIIMIVVLVGAMLFGAWKGLAWQLASLGAVVASYVVALKFREPVASYIQTKPPWNVFLAMLVLYVGTSLIIWIVFRFVSRFIDRLKLKEFDRQIGALFGLAKGVLLCVIITLFAVALLGETERQTIVDSYSGRYIAKLLDKADAVMPREIHDVLHPYVHSLEHTLNGTSPNHGSATDHHHHQDQLDQPDQPPAGPPDSQLAEESRVEGRESRARTDSDQAEAELIPVKELLQALRRGATRPADESIRR